MKPPPVDITEYLFSLVRRKRRRRPRKKLNGKRRYKFLHK